MPLGCRCSRRVSQDAGRPRVDRGFVYILTNDRLNVLYVGSTNDLKKRLAHHQRGLIPGFTKRYNVHRLVYFEEQPDMDAARRRERQLKGLGRAKKDAIVDAANPDRRDLSRAIGAVIDEILRASPSG